MSLRLANRAPRGNVVIVILAVVGVLLLLAIIVGSWLVGINNGIVRKNQAADGAWAQVQSVYQRRLDLIPNLVETVKGAAAHELQVQVGGVQERAKATQVRIDPSNPDQFKDFVSKQAELGSAIGRLLVTVENYPQIKANENFLTLQ